MAEMKTGLFSYRPHWAKRLGTAPFLPRTREEMNALGWDACDIIIVTGDAYVDHPSFGMAIIGRVLEDQGFRVGILDQPDVSAPNLFLALGEPTLFFGVTAGNMDSLVNHYTSDKKPRSDDAYTPGDAAGARPDRACIVYTQRLREVAPKVPVVLGGIEASLRRLAHYDYWSDKVRRSLLIDSGADLLVYGNAERAIVAVAHRAARGEKPRDMLDIRGTVVRRAVGEDGPADAAQGEFLVLSREYLEEASPKADVFQKTVPATHPREKTILRLPSADALRKDRVLYAHGARVSGRETNPHNARCLVQRNGDFDVFVNPPPLPLTTEELDHIYDLPFSRLPHPSHQGKRLRAYEMIRFSVNIMRGCFGGCTFCSITSHEGRIIQSRSETSVLRELQAMKGTPGFTGQVSDLGGPTANMYRMGCKRPDIEAICRKPSCIFPAICKNLNHDHGPLIHLYKTARDADGIRKITIGSGVRYDLAVTSPQYIRELAAHHTGGYLKIAPEHTEEGPLALMMKPRIEVYERFRELFERYSKEAFREQYLIPYFIASHPGSTLKDMLETALWLKARDLRPDQVQAFLPSPMSLATAMYHSGKNPLLPVKREGGDVFTAKSARDRTLQKAMLRYHDRENHPLIREILRQLGREDLIGSGKRCLVPKEAFRAGKTNVRPIPKIRSKTPKMGKRRR